jgi:glycosyltransferase involved in cell wall biosynthesis
MRLVHVLDDVDAVGGVQTYLRQLLPALRERGIESEVIAARGATDLAGVPTTLVPGIDVDGPELPSDAAAAFGRALAAACPDVTVVHIAHSPAVARAAAAHGRVIVYAHDYFMRCPGGARHLERSRSFCEAGPGLRCFWRAYTERTTNRRPDRLLRAYRRVQSWPVHWSAVHRLFVASPFVADLHALEGFPRERLRVVPYPIAPHQPAAPDGAERWDVLSLGRLTASKGVDILLEAVARLDGCRLAIAGDGPERAALEARSSQSDLAGRVDFLGWVTEEQRSQLFAASRVFAMPSVWQEPFGIAGVEALAARLPVVASAVGGIPSWLHDEEAGLLVPEGDAVALAAAIGRLLHDGPLHARLAARGPEVAARFSLDRHLELFMAEVVA